MLFRSAAALLLAQIDAMGDEKEQFAAFADLLALCSKHELVDWLRGEMEARRKVRADDYFTEMALGRILKVTGNKAAAFEVLADASFAAPNQAEALPELVREAEELRKLDAAVRLQAQLVRILPLPGPAALAKLAQLQEKSADPEAAAKTWEKITAKFPRDAGALEQAVEFQMRSGGTARAPPNFCAASARSIRRTGASSRNSRSSIWRPARPPRRSSASNKSSRIPLPKNPPSRCAFRA